MLSSLRVKASLQQEVRQGELQPTWPQDGARILLMLSMKNKAVFDQSPSLRQHRRRQSDGGAGPDCKQPFLLRRALFILNHLMMTDPYAVNVRTISSN
jgi:hypothetical protein